MADSLIIVEVGWQDGCEWCYLLIFLALHPNSAVGEVCQPLLCPLAVEDAGAEYGEVFEGKVELLVDESATCHHLDAAEVLSILHIVLHGSAVGEECVAVEVVDEWCAES